MKKKQISTTENVAMGRCAIVMSQRRCNEVFFDNSNTHTNSEAFSSLLKVMKQFACTRLSTRFFFTSIQAETRLWKDKNRTSLTSSFSPSLSLYLLTPSPLFCLCSDIVAAVLPQLGNACTVTKAKRGVRGRGFEDFFFFYSPQWEMWLSSTQYSLTIIQTYRNKRSNDATDSDSPAKCEARVCLVQFCCKFEVQSAK